MGIHKSIEIPTSEKKKWSRLVRSGCWGRQLYFPWIPLECGSWCLKQHLLLAVSGVVLLGYFCALCLVWGAQRPLPVPGQEPEEIRGGSEAHGEGDGGKREGDEEVDSRADNAGGQSHRGDERVQTGWGESWHHSGLQGKQEKELNPPWIPLTAHSLCRATRLWQWCGFIFYTHLEIYPV